MKTTIKLISLLVLISVSLLACSSIVDAYLKHEFNTVDLNNDNQITKEELLKTEK